MTGVGGAWGGLLAENPPPLSVQRSTIENPKPPLKRPMVKNAVAGTAMEVRKHTTRREFCKVTLLEARLENLLYPKQHVVEGVHAPACKRPMVGGDHRTPKEKIRRYQLTPKK